MVGSPLNALFRRKLKSLVPLFLTAAFFLSACQIPQTQFLSDLTNQLTVQPISSSGCTLKFGIINNSTQALGEELSRGYEMARDEVNAAGGINGCKLSLVNKDDQGDPATAETSARELINDEKVPLIIGSASNLTTLAAAGVADDNNTLFIAPSATGILLSRMGYQSVFRLPATSTDNLVMAYDWLQSVSDPSVPPSLGGIFEYDTSGDSLSAAFLSMASERGWSVVIKSSYQPGQKDFTSTLHWVQSATPDALFIAGSSAEDMLLLLKQMQEMGISPKAIIGLSGVFNDPDFLSQNKELLENFYFLAQWSSDVTWKDENGQDVSHLADAYRERYGQALGMSSLQAYTAVKTATSVLERCLKEQSASSPAQLEQSLQDTMHSIQIDNTLFGMVNFDDHGQNNHQPLLLQMRAGHSRIVYPNQFKTADALYPAPLWHGTAAAAAFSNPNKDTLEVVSPGQNQTHSVLHIGALQAVESLNPFRRTLLYEAFFYQQIYDTLYDLAPDGSYRPSLAQNVQASADNKTYTFTLQKNVKFHDGQPLTASDVVFSLKLYGLQAHAIDDLTVELTLNQPAANIADKLYFDYILPEHIWAAALKDGASPKDFANDPPIGSGPFEFAEFKKGESINFTANNEYWRGAPKVDEMIWQTFIGQPDMLAQALISRQMDAFYDPPLNSINTLKAGENVKVIVGSPVFPSQTLVYFNQIDPALCPKEGGQCLGNLALRDVRVRQALAYATDKQDITNTATLGFTTPGTTIISPALGRWYNTSLKDYTYDLEQANRILDEAGYIDQNNDGVREAPDGLSSLSFRLHYPQGRARYLFERPAEILVNSWSKIGVRLIIQPMEQADLIKKMVPAFDYDLILWSLNSLPDPDLVLSFIYTKSKNSGLYSGGYTSSEYDALYEQQTQETDSTRRQQMIWQMQEILQRDAVHLVLYTLPGVYAVRTDQFSGWPLGTDAVFPLNPAVLSTLEVNK